MDDYEMKQYIDKKDRKERVESLVKQLADELNIMGKEKEVSEYFLEAVQCQHRTLQQNLIMGPHWACATTSTVSFI